jgi:Mn2+/Fe2+ NRAMP family transporter
MREQSSWHWVWLILWIFLFLVPAWKIAKKAGFAGAWSLLMLIPLVNIAMLWVFAFARWPTLREPVD